MTTLGEIAQALAASGLMLRGAFHPAPGDGVPALADGRAAGTLALAGNAGPSLWQAFAPAMPEGRDPLDRWCAERLSALAARFSATLLLPQNGPPYLPFQRWAMRAEPIHPSPLGVLIHPDYGLWHGYRGALALAERLELPEPDRRPSPCDSCAERPCLSACPVSAFSGEGYDVPACAAHIGSSEGSDCLGFGCRARRACPVGRAYVYAPDQARHHMEWFLRSVTRRP